MAANKISPRATKKISELDSVESLSGSELIPVVHNGTTRKATMDQVGQKAIERVRPELDSTIERFENEANVVLSGLGYLPPVPYASGLNVNSTRFTVIRDGQVYAPAAPVPFTTGAWNAEQWRLVQGVTGADLSSTTGAGMVGFRQQGASAVPRTLLDKEREIRSARDNGASAGASDQYLPIESAVIDYDSVLLSEKYFAVGVQNSGVRVQRSGVSIYGHGDGGLKTQGANQSALTIAKYAPVDIDLQEINVSRLTLEQSADHTSNDFSTLRVHGLKGGLIDGNVVPAGYVGASVGIVATPPQHVPFSEIRSEGLVFSGNRASVSNMAFEMFCTKASAIAGNVAVKKGGMASSHAFRFTGYGVKRPNAWGNSPERLPTVDVDLKLYGNASAGNVSHNYANGIAYQSGGRANAHVGYAITKATNGVLAGTYPDEENIPEFNVFSALAVDDVGGGLSIPNVGRTIFADASISGFSYRGINHQTLSANAGDGRFNRLSGLIGKGSGAPVVYSGSNARIDLTICDSSYVGPAVLLTGSYNHVVITCGNLTQAPGYVINVAGDHNIVDVVFSDIAAMYTDVVVSGDNNIVRINGQPKADRLSGVEITGVDNIVSGHARLSVPAPGNDVSGLYGARKRGTVTATTNSNGIIAVTHGCISTPRYTSAIARANQPYVCTQIAYNASVVEFKVWSATTGSAVANTQVTLDWTAEI